MATKKTTTQTKEKARKTTKKARMSMLDYLRFGESYTSLVLGIIVVVIATILLLSFIHSKNVSKSPQNEQIATITEATVKTSDEEANATASGKGKSESTPTPTPTKPAATPTPSAEPTPTQSAPTSVPTKPRETRDGQKNDGKKKERTYVVKANDSLWSIAEKEYKDGYKWVEIARANKLNNPGTVFKGDKLVLPEVEQKNTTAKVEEKKEKTAATGTNKITGNKYTIVSGDTLWSIAERAYGDGFKWVAIAKANKLTDPALIHSKNTLSIPRK